jgi:anhydro-N-acetylmuramic acid kinase
MCSTRAPATERLFIGLMSGTSIDAVDGALVAFGADGRPSRTLAICSFPFDDALRAELTRLQRPLAGDLEAAAAAGVALAERYADAVDRLLTESATAAAAVTAIGAHGQTVRHRPERGYTIQVLAPAHLAERCGIDVVADLRSADIAAGGQGAPLVPGFHRLAFGANGTARAIVNIGGIANITVLAAGGAVTGHDTGPGNTLLDSWCQRHRNERYDDAGRWAASGTVDAALLTRLLAEPYFARGSPKSTGRDLFHLEWLDHRLQGLPALAAVDVQATLLELTARTLVDDLARTGAKTVHVCGGGARNDALMARLAQLLAARLPGVPLASTDALGIAPQAVECCAFAWLAMRRVDRLPGSLETVTGARGPRVAGAIYPAARC